MRPAHRVPCSANLEGSVEDARQAGDVLPDGAKGEGDGNSAMVLPSPKMAGESRGDLKPMRLEIL